MADREGRPFTIYVCPECGGPAYLWDAGGPGIEPAWIYRCPVHEVWGERVVVAEVADDDEIVPGVTRAEAKATLSASEGMADLP